MPALTIILLLLALILIPIIGFFAYIGYSRQREYLLAKSTVTLHSDPLLEAVDPDGIALVYFTAEWCAPCKTMQTPAIEALQSDMPELAVITVDTEENPEIAKRWHVMSLPRTFIIGKNHQVCFTNIDVVDKETLKTQIETAQFQQIDAIQIVRNAQGLQVPKLKIGRS